MYLLYSLLLTLGFIVLLPRFVMDAFRHGKYITGLGQRLGNIPNPKSNKPLIWLHCVSVGETQAAQTLVRALSERFPAFDLVVSTTTVTGQQVAQDTFGDQAALVFYFPIDWAWTVRRVLRKLRPRAVLIMETELWPHLFRECRKDRTPVALVNGRISDKSFGRYKLVLPFLRRVLHDLTIALMQSERDAERIRDLGCSPQRVQVAGNLKFDSANIAGSNTTPEELLRRFDLRSKPLIVAASTHAPEEKLVLEAFKRTRERDRNARLLIAPRHPERFAEVAALLAGSGLTSARRSQSPRPDDATCDVVLLDSIGDLRAVYPASEIVFVGGSIAPHGGHNVLEPAAFGVCTVTGPHTENFTAITKAMLEERALIKLPGSEYPVFELTSVLVCLLEDQSLRHEIGERARTVCQRNQGATGRTVELIAQVLEPSGTLNREDSFPAALVSTAK